VPVRPPALPRICRVAGAALLGSAAVLVAVPAVAVPTCSFDASTGAVTVVVGTGETAVVARSGDAITLNGAPCDAATVTTTETIAVDGSAGGANVTLDLSGGPFEPGMTPEANGTSEIEFTLTVPGASTVLLAGGAQADHIVLGADGANLNAAETAGDADVVIVGTPAVTIQGNAGADTLSVAGGAGTGAPNSASVAGGADDDDLVGGLGGSAFDGGDGVDSVDYAAAAGVLADLAGGLVLHAAGGQDSTANVEDLLGSPAADVIVGTEQANALGGKDGDDRIAGGEGDDALDGGSGVDTVRFRAAVDVDLRDGTATGEGDDSLTAFENVMGSTKADTIHGDDGRNRLAGGSGADQLFAHGGADVVTGGKGNDRLNGREGPDALFGRAGRDQLDGGKAEDSCKGGPDPDSFVLCEKIVLD
jgi:Ca2+-binding RTX toxin-like protein